MRTFDLSPLYRSTVGFDRLFGLLDSLAGADSAAQTYPPYNIERTGENAYRVTMAVAGFGEDDIAIEAKENTLTVKGEKKAETEREGERVPLSRHRRARLRAPLPARRPCRGEGREPRERPPPHRSRPRDSRGDEAPHDRHRQRQGARPSRSSQGRRLTSGDPVRRREGALRGALFICAQPSEERRRSGRPRRPSSGSSSPAGPAPRPARPLVSAAGCPPSRGDRRRRPPAAARRAPFGRIAKISLAVWLDARAAPRRDLRSPAASRARHRVGVAGEVEPVAVRRDRRRTARRRTSSWRSRGRRAGGRSRNRAPAPGRRRPPPRRRCSRSWCRRRRARRRRPARSAPPASTPRPATASAKRAPSMWTASAAPLARPRRSPRSRRARRRCRAR